MPSAATTPAPDPLAGHARYAKVRDLSSGAFGFVQLCTNLETQEQVAIKFIERGDCVSRYVEAEILNHRKLCHPHVIEFKEVFLTADYICIVMEYASGGNLFAYVQRAGRLQEAAARWFFQQLIIGLDYCHEKGVVNRDIKLENTLLTMIPNLPLPLLKICDFGYSKAQTMSAPKSKVGTLAYMAPEVIKVKDKYDGKLADLWSCGVMLYVMLFGSYPFESPVQQAVPPTTRVQNMMQRIMDMQWTMPQNVDVSAECRELLCGLLVGEPAHRLTMDQIKVHRWFTANLPPSALAMNQEYLRNTDHTGTQTVQEIKDILEQARTPGPSRYNNYNAEEEYDNVIDTAIEDELEHHPSAIDVQRTKQAVAAAVRAAAAATGQQQRQSTAGVAGAAAGAAARAPTAGAPAPRAAPQQPQPVTATLPQGAPAAAPPSSNQRYPAIGVAGPAGAGPGGVAVPRGLQQATTLPVQQSGSVQPAPPGQGSIAAATIAGVKLDG